MTKNLITGANGQLGSELRNLLDERGIAYDAFDSKQMDITDQAVVNEKISALKPEVIYHCAAYTAVDNAEDIAKDLNWQVNVDGTRNVAEAAKRVGAKMVYISTEVSMVRILYTQCFVLPKTMISLPSLTINLAAQRGLELL